MPPNNLDTVKYMSVSQFGQGKMFGLYFIVLIPKHLPIKFYEDITGLIIKLSILVTYIEIQYTMHRELHK